MNIYQNHLETLMHHSTVNLAKLMKDVDELDDIHSFEETLEDLDYVVEEVSEENYINVVFDGAKQLSFDDFVKVHATKPGLNQIWFNAGNLRMLVAIKCDALRSDADEVKNFVNWCTENKVKIL